MLNKEKADRTDFSSPRANHLTSITRILNLIDLITLKGTFLRTWIPIDWQRKLKAKEEKLMKRYWLTVAMGAIGPMLAVTAALGAPDNISFPMVRSSAAMAATSELGDGNRA